MITWTITTTYDHLNDRCLYYLWSPERSLPLMITWPITTTYDHLNDRCLYSLWIPERSLLLVITWMIVVSTTYDHLNERCLYYLWSPEWSLSLLVMITWMIVVSAACFSSSWWSGSSDNLSWWRRSFSLISFSFIKEFREKKHFSLKLLSSFQTVSRRGNFEQNIYILQKNTNRQIIHTSTKIKNY